jgi:hypothetical protein
VESKLAVADFDILKTKSGKLDFGPVRPGKDAGGTPAFLG